MVCTASLYESEKRHQLGEIHWVHVHLVCDTDIRGECCGTRTTRFMRGYNVRHMVLGLIETVRFNGTPIFDIWFEIQGRGGVGLTVLKVDGEDLGWNINCKQKVYFWMRKICFVFSGRVYELLLEVFQMKEHGFGFIGDRCNKKQKGFSDDGYDGFK